MTSPRSELLKDLPDDIILDIVSRNFTNKQAIQLGLASKAIFQLVQNRSSLIFKFGGEEKRYKEELDYLHKTLRRYHEEDIHLETFTLTFRGHDPYFRLTGYQCIDLATKKSLKILNLESFRFDPNVFILPEEIYAVESLVDLSLKGWYLKHPTTISWPNLKRLCLNNVYDRNVLSLLEDVTRSSPLLESFEIYRSSWGSKFNFRVSNLHNLKQLSIRLIDSAKTFEVSGTPNLESITCSYDQHHPDLILNMPCYHKFPIANLGQLRYQNLRTLSFHNFYRYGMDDIFFPSFSREFPQLQELSMDTNDDLQLISLSSASLKKIRLANMKLLKEARFDVPNIVHFGFESYNSIEHHLSLIDETDGSIWPQLSFTGNPNGWISGITLGSQQWRIECGAKWCWSPTSIVMQL